MSAAAEETSNMATKLQEAKLKDEMINSCTALVLTGPVIGKVTATSAIVLLEVDELSIITCIFTAVVNNEKGNDDDKPPHELRSTREFPAHRPRAFQVDGLLPNTVYTYTFEGIAPSHIEEMKLLNSKVKTFPNKILKIKLNVLSCDQPRRMIDGDENPWDRLNHLSSNDECDIMLHLGIYCATYMIVLHRKKHITVCKSNIYLYMLCFSGDQVYTKMDGFLERAEMKMSAIDSHVVTEHSKTKMRKAAEEELRGAYRYVWNQPSTRATLR